MAAERFEFATVDYPFDFRCGHCGYGGRAIVRGRGEERRKARRARDTAHSRALAEARQLALLAVCPTCGRRRGGALARWVATTAIGLAGFVALSYALWNDWVVIRNPLVNRAVVVMFALLVPVLFVQSLGMFGRARREVRWGRHEA